MHCAKCGQIVEQGHHFCGNCGEPVSPKKFGKRNTLRSGQLKHAANIDNLFSLKAREDAHHEKRTESVNVSVTDDVEQTSSVQQKNNVAQQDKDDEAVRVMKRRYNKFQFGWRAFIYITFMTVTIFMIIFDIMNPESYKPRFWVKKYMNVILADLFCFWLYFRCLVRRIHDANYSKVYIWIYYFIVYMGIIICIFSLDISNVLFLTLLTIFLLVYVPAIALMLLPSYPETNKWGPPSE